MNTYHICYLIDSELCTGVNVNADDYMKALTKFNKLHNKAEIIYISKLN